MAAFLGMTKRMVRSIATPGRLIAMSTVGIIGIIIGVVVDRSDPGPEFAVDFLSRFGLIIYVPLVVLVISTATLGTLVEEKTLVYFWMRPIGRWQITAAALLAGLVVLVPLILVPLGVLAAVVGDGNDVSGIIVSSLVGIMGYTSLFTLLGLVTQRALAWGLGYILVWEGFVAGLSRSAGWLALRTYTTSALSRIADSAGPIADPAAGSTIAIVTVGVFVCGALLTTWRLNTADVA